MPVSTLVPSVLFLLIISLSSRANAAQQCFAADGVDLKAAVNKYYAGNWAAADTEKYGSIEDWCTKFVTTMRDLFRDKHTFNSNISAWDTSSVTDMKYMFLQANAFNQDVSAWNTSSVNTMAAMFHASAFNQDVSAWDTSKVTEMYGMFNAARAFNQDISAWDTSKVTNMESMFSYASAFNQDLSVWDTSSVTNMISMFEEARAFNQNLCAWKDKFPYITAFQIFSDSGCTYKATPVQSNQGPFCAGSAADCQAYTVEGCPDEFEEGTDYEEGDKMSIISDGEDYGKIYECKGWPVTDHCKSEAYSPLNNDKACGGEVCWPVAWTYEGGCTGTITPTGAPQFESLSKWVKEGCPPEYVPNNSAYMPEDYVSVSKNEDNTYGVVWQCKNAMTAPWCQQEGYAPGTQNGDQAWEKVGHCDGTISPTVSPTMLASNPNPIKRVCQFKYKLDTTSDGEYIVLQAGSWEKGGTSFVTVTGGAPFDLFKAGHVVRDGTDARKCNRWPFTPYCNQFSPFVRDASDYNPIFSRKGWDKVTCENVVSVVDDVTGIEDEFNPAIPGPVFASNGHLLVKKDGTCVNLAINPEDYFKSSPAVKGCQKCATDNGFGSSADPTLCTPCQGGATSKIVDGKSQCVVDGNTPSQSAEPSSQPSLSPSPSGQPSSEPSSQPSLSPSSSGQPSSWPSASPSASGEPSSQPSLAPSQSAEPSSQPSLSPSSSGQPSSEPSSQPSLSASPLNVPSDQPSDLPSNVPTSSNQPSDLPSLSPSTVLTSSYEYVGVGPCTGYGGYYDFVRFDGIVTANACAVKCNDCVAGNVSGGEFRGFAIRPDIQRCDCSIDNDASYTGTGSCAATSVNGSHRGVGPITGSNMSATAFDCYKIKA